MSTENYVSNEVLLVYEQNTTDFIEMNQRLDALQDIARARLEAVGVELPLEEFRCLLCNCPGYSGDPSIPTTSCICNHPAHTHYPV